MIRLVSYQSLFLFDYMYSLYLRTKGSGPNRSADGSNGSCGQRQRQCRSIGYRHGSCARAGGSREGAGRGVFRCHHGQSLGQEARWQYRRYRHQDQEGQDDEEAPTPSYLKQSSRSYCHCCGYDCLCRDWQLLGAIRLGPGFSRRISSLHSRRKGCHEVPL